MNYVAIMGRLTASSELETTESGKKVASFSIAVNERYKGKERTDFILCTAWGSTAEFIHKYFTKGAMIAIEGSIREDSYTDKNGNKRYKCFVLVKNAHFTGERRKETQEEELPFGDSIVDDLLA